MFDDHVNLGLVSTWPGHGGRPALCRI